MEGVRVSVLFCNLGWVCGGFGDVRYVCVVFWVFGDEMFIFGIYAATKGKARPQCTGIWW
jgi:hypothetical protein